MIGIIVVGHGHFASGLVSASQLIFGEGGALLSVDFVADDSSEDLEAKLKTASEQVMQSSKGLVFLCDLGGGSPFRTAALLASKEPRFATVSGIKPYGAYYCPE